MGKLIAISVVINFMLYYPIMTGPAGAEENYCAQFEESLDSCEIEYDVKLKCGKGVLMMGGDVISTSHSAITLQEHIEFSDDFEYKMENYGKNRFRILCKKKTPRGVWRSIKEVIVYKTEKTLSPIYSKKKDQPIYVVTRGGSESTSGHKSKKKSLDKQFLVLIPEIPLSIKNDDSRPCEFEIVDYAGEKKISQSVASGEIFLAHPEKIGLQIGGKYLLRRISGDVVESAHLVVAKDENTAAIASVLSEIDADSSYTKEERRILKITYLSRINELYDQYKLHWLIDYLESED